MKKISLLVCLLAFLCSCGPTEYASKAPLPKLVHEVFLDLKPESSLDSVILSVQELKNIPCVFDLQIGEFKDLSDPRALETDLIFTMKFMDELDYEKYQNHSIHLKLKSELGSKLAKAPQTVDYILK